MQCHMQGKELCVQGMEFLLSDKWSHLGVRVLGAMTCEGVCMNMC